MRQAGRQAGRGREGEGAKPGSQLVQLYIYRYIYVYVCILCICFQDGNVNTTTNHVLFNVLLSY